MSRKEKLYGGTHIDLCRNCAGAGVAAPKQPAADRAERAPEPVPCHVCGGSGRVLKTTSVKVTIEPYAGTVGP